MKESKQDVFDRIVTEWGLLIQKREGWSNEKRDTVVRSTVSMYDAAVQCPLPLCPQQSACPYCHVDADGVGKTIEDDMDYMYLLCDADGWSMCYDRDAWTTAMVSIHFCPMCGRKLEGS